MILPSYRLERMCVDSEMIEIGPPFGIKLFERNENISQIRVHISVTKCVPKLHIVDAYFRIRMSFGHAFVTCGI